MLDDGEQVAHGLRWDERGGPRLLEAQWNQPLQRVLQTLLVGGAGGEFGDHAVVRLGQALTGGGPDGTTGGGNGLPPAVAGVAYLQNHACIGTRALGERIHVLASGYALEAATALLLLAPAPPLLFMGQEFAAAQPFLYFSDFRADLIKMLNLNWRRQFSRQRPFHTPRGRARIPVPNDPGTFRRCVLDWNSLEQSPHIDWLRWHRRLLSIRRREIVPRLRGMADEQTRFQVLGERGLWVRWVLGDDSVLSVVINLGGKPLEGIGRPAGTLLYSNDGSLEDSLAQHRLQPWSLGWFLEFMG
jgi:1,4-alpha-glucan branching enzyme